MVFTGVLQGDRKTKGFLPNGVSEGYAISQTPQVVLDYQATDFNGELLVNWDYVIDGKMFQVNEVEGSVLSWCASRESNMLEIDPTELFRGLQ